MICDLRYSLEQLLPYINWTYFYHVWKVKAGSAEANEVRHQALDLVLTEDRVRHWHVTARIGLFECNSQDEDIMLYGDAGEVVQSLHLLRQQHPTAPDAPCLCLADFVRPLNEGGLHDRIGLFGCCADADMERFRADDIYLHLLVQTLSDRLAEAGIERAHEEVRKHLWGYAPHEDLNVADILAGHYQGIRPAVGYPSLPDQRLIFDLDALLHLHEIGITLTSTGAMLPHASVCGLMLAHPQARYFSVTDSYSL